MKPWDDAKKYIKANNWSIFSAFCLFCFFAGIICISSTIEAAIPQQEMSIEYKSGNVTVRLKGVEIRSALEDIAQKTGIVFVGLDNITGIIEDLEFDNLSLEEAIKKVGKDSIMIFRKEGPYEGKKEIKKVIILAKQEEKQVPSPAPPPEPPQKPPFRPLPPPSSEIEKIPPPPSPPPVDKPKPIPIKSEPPPPPPPKPKPVEVESVPKPAPKPAPKPKTVEPSKAYDENLSKGMAYYEQKRWDLAIKYFKIYVEDHPNDINAQNKISQANQNAQDSISLYESAKKAENAGNVEEALELYKKSYSLYPLLYDTWERIQNLKKK